MTEVAEQERCTECGQCLQYSDAVCMEAGLLATKCLNNPLVRIRIPRVASNHQRDALISTLVKTFEQTPADCKWSVDVSKPRKLKLSVIGALYAHKLAFGKRTITLTGIRPEQVSPWTWQKLNESFQIE